MKVTLIAHSPMPEYLIAASAKLCYTDSGAGDLLQNLNDEKVNSFVEMLREIGHESPIEHVSFTFGIEGVSRTFLAQITRHRIASYSVQSQRYVKQKNFVYITPPAIEEDAEALALYQQSMQNALDCYNQLADRLSAKYKSEFLEQGLPEKSAASKAEKKAIEDARFVLPNACETKMVVTMNARSLMNFFEHRCCNRAQWEIRDVADEMLRLCCEVSPTLFKNAGPPCLKGTCPEGKMSCGKMKEIRSKYEKMKEMKVEQ